jgi:hypothetical protein
MSGISVFNIERDGLQEIYNGSANGVSVYLKIPAVGLDVDTINALGEGVTALFNKAIEAREVAIAARKLDPKDRTMGLG